MVAHAAHIAVTGPTQPLLSGFALELSEQGYPLWYGPPFPDGTSLLVVGMAHERVSWLRTRAQRLGFKTRTSHATPQKFLQAWSLAAVQGEPPPVAQPFRLRVRTPQGTQTFRCFDHQQLPIARSLLAIGIVPRIAVTAGYPLLYAQGSVALRRALIRHHISCTPVVSFPITQAFNRISVREDDHWRVQIIPSLKTYEEDHNHLTYTVSEESHQQLLAKGDVGYSGEGVILWSISWDRIKERWYEEDQLSQKRRRHRQSRNRAAG